MLLQSCRFGVLKVNAVSSWCLLHPVCSGQTWHHALRPFSCTQWLRRSDAFILTMHWSDTSYVVSPKAMRLTRSRSGSSRPNKKKETDSTCLHLVTTVSLQCTCIKQVCRCSAYITSSYTNSKSLTSSWHQANSFWFQEGNAVK